MVDLLPCPFCGGTNLKSGGDDKFVGVRCLDCETNGPNHYNSKFDWDIRHPAPETRTDPIDAPDAMQPETGPVDWLWFGNGKVTFGRWARFPGQYRYKLAEIQPTEHDHPQSSTAMSSKALADIASERQRQISVEGWSTQHDDEHEGGQLAAAAGVYALVASERHNNIAKQFWPWDFQWWKPCDARRNLVKAGALIAAEIERLDRTDALSRPRNDRGGANG